jgi:hemolysin activation/secretion protein
MAPPAGQTTPPTREEIDRFRPATPDASRGRLEIEAEADRQPCPLEADEFKAITVAISSATFNGLLSVSPDLLRPAYAAYLGTTQPIAVVCTIRDNATRILREAGYLAAVQVPPQRIENGVVSFDVVLGRLVAIRVRGDVGRSEAKIQSILEKLNLNQPFNIIDAERTLLLVRDIPGYRVRLGLRPAGREPGEIIGEVTVIRRLFELDANVQNLGSRAAGPTGGALRGRFYGLTGLADQTTVTLFNTLDVEEQSVVGLGHAMMLGSDGLTLSGNITFAATNPTVEEQPDLDLASRSWLGTVELSYPLVRSQARNLRVAAGLDLIDQDISIDRIDLSQDKLRVLYLRIDGELVDRNSVARFFTGIAQQPRWRLGGSLELRKGIDIFNASEGCGPNGQNCGPGVLPPGRFNGDPQAFLVRFSGLAELRLTEQLWVSVAPRAQYTDQRLLSYEQFSAGNYTIGRGFEPGSLIGDSGVGFSAEVKYGRPVPRTPDDLVFQPYAFVDAAWTWNKDRDPEDDPANLVSVGAGARLLYGDRVRLDVTFAIPTTRLADDLPTRKPRVLVTLATSLWPWTR